MSAESPLVEGSPAWALDYAKRYWTFGREPESQLALHILAASTKRLQAEVDRLVDLVAQCPLGLPNHYLCDCEGRK